MKFCSKCKEFKPLQGFGSKSWINSDGSKTFTKKSHCRDCVNKDNLERYHKNLSTKDSHKKASYKHRLKGYGLTPEEYEAMLSRQEYKCSICGTAPDRLMSVDHDHSTGQIRSLLCNNCNAALGMVKEDKKVLQNMIEYLEKYNGDVCS